MLQGMGKLWRYWRATHGFYINIVCDSAQIIHSWTVVDQFFSPFLIFGWHSSCISLALFYGGIPTCWRRWSPTSYPGNEMKIKERDVELQLSEDITCKWKLGRQGNMKGKCWTCNELSDISHNPEHFLVCGLNVCWHFHFMNCYNVKIVWYSCHCSHILWHLVLSFWFIS